MASRSYAPQVSSPLNPEARSTPQGPQDPQDPERRARRRRGRTGRGRGMIRGGMRGSVSPTERLLRHKAAAAWQAQALGMREGAIRAGKTEQQSQSPRHPVAARKDDGMPYLFHMPDLGFFTPQKVVRAMSIARRMPLPRGHQPRVKVV